MSLYAMVIMCKILFSFKNMIKTWTKKLWNYSALYYIEDWMDKGLWEERKVERSLIIRIFFCITWNKFCLTNRWTHLSRRSVCKGTCIREFRLQFGTSSWNWFQDERRKERRKGGSSRFGLSWHWNKDQSRVSNLG